MKTVSTSKAYLSRESTTHITKYGVLPFIPPTKGINLESNISFIPPSYKGNT